MDGNVVGIAAVHVLSDIGSNEETLVEENSFVGGIGIDGGAFSMEMMEMQVLETSLVRAAFQRIYENVGGAGNAAKVYMIVRVYCFYSGIRSDVIYLSHWGLFIVGGKDKRIFVLLPKF